jgi:hypothetical protein
MRIFDTLRKLFDSKYSDKRVEEVQAKNVKSIRVSKESTEKYKKLLKTDDYAMIFYKATREEKHGN